MPKGISPTIQAELNKTTLPDIVYALRVHLVAGIQRWSNRRLEGVELIGDPAPQIYTPRLADISGLDHDPAQSAPVTITLANWDDAITNLDLTESFAGAPCEFIEFIPSLNESLIKWSGSLDELSEISPEFATLTAYPESATTRFGVPRRAIALPCPHDFGKASSVSTAPVVPMAAAAISASGRCCRGSVPPSMPRRIRRPSRCAGRRWPSPMERHSGEAIVFGSTMNCC
jgi:hypothetical protein